MSGIISENTGKAYFFPNPSDGKIMLSDKLMPNTLIEVIDATGKTIYRETIHELNYKIDLTGKSGLYLMKITEENESRIQKLIIK